MLEIKEYVEKADGLAQNVVNAWGLNMLAGNGPFLANEFVDVFDKACRFRTIRSVANNCREFGILTQQFAVEEIETRQAFAEAYRCFEQKRL